MKNLMFLCLLLAASFATAQKVTQNDLQGTWKMIGFNASGIYLDLVTAEVTIAPEIESQIAPEMAAQIKAEMKAAAAPLSSSFVNFTGNAFKQTLGMEEEKGTFTVTERDNKQYLDIVLADGIPDTAAVTIKDGRLYITQTDGNEQAEFIYTKQ